MSDILFLDDMAWRHTEFRKKTIGYTVHQAWSAAQAIDLLGRVKFTQVFLDHDLCDEDVMAIVGQPTEQPTGMAVVDHILTMDDPPQDIIIHSLNGPARMQMLVRLQDSGRIARVRAIPFTDLIHRL